MKLTILGCDGSFPSLDGACPGYLLEHQGRRVLLDAGSGVLPRLMERGLDGLEAVVLSHLHWDHCSDALTMNYALKVLGEQRIALYHPGKPGQIAALFDGWEGGKPLVYNQDSVLEIGGMRFCFFPMRHPVLAYGMRIECSGKVFAYTGDTNTTPELLPLLQGADLALMDAVFTDEKWSEPAYHLSGRLAAQAAAQAGCAKLVLTHLPCIKEDRKLLLAQAQEEFAHCELACYGAEYIL